MGAGVSPGLLDGVNETLNTLERRLHEVERRLASFEDHDSDWPEWAVKLRIMEAEQKRHHDRINSHRASLDQGGVRFALLFGADGQPGVLETMRQSIDALHGEVAKLRSELGKQGRRHGMAAALGTALGAGLTELRRLFGGH